TPLCRYIISRAPDFPMPPDWRVLGYVAGVVLLTGVLAGLAPAFESIKVELNAGLKGAGGALAGSSGTRRWLGILVSAQVAMSMVLMVCAGLLGQAEDRNLRGNPGYLPQKVVVAPLRIEATQVRLNAIARRIKALPGVRSVTFSDTIPLFNPDTVELPAPGYPPAVQPV